MHRDIAAVLFVGGFLVLGLTVLGVGPLGVIVGNGGGCTPGANAFQAYINSNGQIEMDGFSCTGTGTNGGAQVYGWVVGSSGAVLNSIQVVSDQYGNFKLVFGVLPVGTYSATASLCPQGSQSACAGQVNWTAGFNIATVSTPQSTTVTVIQSQTLTTASVASVCISNCGPGPSYLGYFISAGLFIAGGVSLAFGGKLEGEAE